MNKEVNIELKTSFLKSVKSRILESEPDAEVFLFGSRARGDFNEDSDWDFLIILPDKITFPRRLAVTRSTSQLEIQTNQIFNRIFYSKNEWLNDKFVHETPFYKNVSKDAILL